MLNKCLENVELIFSPPSSPTPATSGGGNAEAPAVQHRSTSAGARRSSGVRPVAVLPHRHGEDARGGGCGATSAAAVVAAC